MRRRLLWTTLYSASLIGCAAAPADVDDLHAEARTRRDAGLRADASARADAGLPTPGLDAGLAPSCDFPALGDDTARTPAPGVRTIVPGALYVQYSGLLQDGRRFETSNTFVLRGVDEVGAPVAWIAGSGYGDGAYLSQFPNRLTQASERSGAADAADVDGILRCFGERDTLRLRVLAPHGHSDHINQDFLGALMALGYSWDNLTVYVHTRDYAAITCTSCAHPADPPLSAEVLARVVTLGTTTSACDESLLEFDTPTLGRWVVTSDDEDSHTAGVINLDGAQLGVRLAGAQFQDHCTRATGSGQALRADPDYAYSRSGLLRIANHSGLRAADFAQ